MSRASRLLDLMELLRRRRAPVTGPALAEELGISLRTLYRDIATLQAQGADIRGEPGIGYVLRPGFTLPPMMLSAEEIEALVLGSRWVALRGDVRLAKAAEGAVAKIRAVLPSELRESIDATTATVPVVTSAKKKSVDVSALRDAIRAERKIEMLYRDSDAKETRRTIWPLQIGFMERVEVVAAWCELRRDFRCFRLDRIASLTMLGEGYPRPRAALVEEWKERDGRSTADRT